MVLGGIHVESGNIIFCDRDGVVMVSLGMAQAVLASLERVRAAEAVLEAKVKAGPKVPDFVEAIVASDRVEEIG